MERLTLLDFKHKKTTNRVLNLFLSVGQIKLALAIDPIDEVVQQTSRHEPSVINVLASVFFSVVDEQTDIVQLESSLDAIQLVLSQITVEPDMSVVQSLTNTIVIVNADQTMSKLKLSLARHARNNTCQREQILLLVDKNQNSLLANTSSH